MDISIKLNSNTRIEVSSEYRGDITTLKVFETYDAVVGVNQEKMVVSISMAEEQRHQLETALMALRH